MLSLSHFPMAVPLTVAPLAPPLSVRVSLIVSCLLLLFFAHQSFAYCPDDAFITYRYSQNLANGFGPVFNPGLAEHVEGFSCPLYMLLIAILIKLPLGIDLLFRAKLIGVVFGLLTLIVAQRLAEQLKFPRWAVCAVPLVTAVHASLSISCVDGMETVLGSLLTTSAALWFLRAFSSSKSESEDENETPQLKREEGSRAALYAGLLFAGCALTRPEGLLGGLFALIALLVVRKGKVGKDGLRFALAFLVPVVLYFVWRRFYYGLWLPNTYYAKGAPLDEAFTKGAPYLLKTFFVVLNESVALATAGGIWWLLAITGAIGERAKRFPALVLPLILVAQMIFVIRSGGDWMGGWRYMAVAMPIGMILAIAGLIEVGLWLPGKAGETSSLAKGIGIAGTLLLLGFGLWGQISYWTTEKSGYLSWASRGYTFDTRKLLKGRLLQRAVEIADRVNAVIPPGKTIAYTEMGVTPFYCPKHFFLDCDGLTDSGVASLPGVKHTQIGVKDTYTSTAGIVGAYLKDVRKPDYLMLSTSTPHGTPFLDPGPALDGAYEVISTSSVFSDTPESDLYLVIWKRI